MNGKNQMTLNQATMAKAVQHYFDTVLFQKDQSPTVVTVSYSSRNGFSCSFDINIKNDEGDGGEAA